MTKNETEIIGWRCEACGYQTGDRSVIVYDWIPTPDGSAAYPAASKVPALLCPECGHVFAVLGFKERSEEEIRQARTTYRKQLKVAMRLEAEIPCAECGNPVPVWNLFKCRICKLWFCSRCALPHFGLVNLGMGAIAMDETAYAKREES